MFLYNEPSLSFIYCKRKYFFLMTYWNLLNHLFWNYVTLNNKVFHFHIVSKNKFLESLNSICHLLFPSNLTVELDNWLIFHILFQLRLNRLPEGTAPHFISKPKVTQTQDSILIQLDLSANPTPSATWFLGNKSLDELGANFVTKMERKGSDHYVLSMEIQVRHFCL